MGAAPACCSSNVELDDPGAAQTEFNSSEPFLADSRVASNSIKAVDPKEISGATVRTEVNLTVDPPLDDQQEVNARVGAPLAVEGCDQKGNRDADVSREATLLAEATSKKDGECVNHSSQPLSVTSDENYKQCDNGSTEVSLAAEPPIKTNTDGANDLTEAAAIHEASGETDTHDATETDMKGAPQTSKAKPKLQSKHKATAPNAFPACYEGIVVHELFPGKRIPLTVKLDSDTRGSWTTGSKTLKLHVEWKGDKVSLREGMTECHGTRDSKGNLKGEVIQEGTPGGTFEFKLKKAKPKKS